jgi:hypothetical protein
VVISGPHGMKKWFANRDKGIFAVDRFNHFLKNLNMPVVYIAAVKRGGGSH